MWECRCGVCGGVCACVCVRVCVCVCGVPTRPRVYVQNVAVYAGTTLACVSTCTCGAGTHGDVSNLHTGCFGWAHGGFSARNTKRNTKRKITRNITQGRVSSPVLLTKKSSRRVLTWPQRGSPQKPLDLTNFKFENRSRTTRSRVLQSFALPDEAVQLQLSWESAGGTSCEIVLFVCRPYTQVQRTICISVSHHTINKHKDTHTHMYM